MKQKKKINSEIEYDGNLNIAIGQSRTTKTWKNKTITWSELLDMLNNPVETFETPEEYKAFPKSKRDDIKDVGGIVAGWLKEGKRKKGYVQQRSMVILDADSTTIHLWETFQFIFANAVAICTTHSHTQENPRYRVFIPLKRPVTAEEFEPLARKLASLIGMDNFDDTTYEPSRLMHKPSHSKGAEYFTDYMDLPWLDPDEVLNQYEDWRDAAYWPESSRGHSIRERQAKKAGDPLEKKGIIGAFCRTYNIAAAIETFLPDVYQPTTHEDRWTFLGGSTTGGLISYDDKFAYSHHGTDPVGDKLANAFDLVRIHKFGNLDEDVKTDTPINRYPSYKAMSEFAEKDGQVKKELVKEQLAQAQEDFDFNTLDDDEWLAKLRLNGHGKFENSIYNGYLLLENLPALKQGLVYNEFSHCIEKVIKFPWEKSKGKEWTDNDSVLLRAYLDEFSKFKVDKNTIRASILQSANQRCYHPVKNYIERDKWDGVKRIEKIFIDYLGVEDTDYSRAVTRKWFVGAVARIYRPGVKFEIVPIFSGAQGIGKSTLIKKLAPEFFSDSLRGLGDSKDDLQFLVGSWLLEISELSAMKKTEVEKTKQFISSTEDRFRAAYGEIPQKHPRTCVFIGTSNIDQYLKDVTGNRRFYPLPCDQQRQKNSVYDGSLEKIVSQIWAEAKHYFDNGEELYLKEEIEKIAHEMQEGAMIEDIAVSIIAGYLEIEIPENWYELDIGTQAAYMQKSLNGGDDLFPEIKGKLQKRQVVTSKEVLREAFNVNFNLSFDARSNIQARKIGVIMAGMQGWKHQTIRLPGASKVEKGFKRL